MLILNLGFKGLELSGALLDIPPHHDNQEKTENDMGQS